jgi:protein tyrosine phosphatase type 4A
MPMAHFLNHPSMTEIRFKDLRFLITDSPADENLPSFIETCLKYGVTALVRVSEKTYDTKAIEAAGIKFYVCRKKEKELLFFFIQLFI